MVNDGTGDSTVRLYANLNDLTNGNTYGCSLSYEQFLGTSFSMALVMMQAQLHFQNQHMVQQIELLCLTQAVLIIAHFRVMELNLPWNSSIVLFDAQVEEGVSSPLLTSTRSDTASLIDLKRTTSFDVSNVSFDSNAQLELDGTNDYLLTSDNVTITGDQSIETLIKCLMVYRVFFKV